MVDNILILRKLSELDDYYLQINEYASITAEEYAKDWKIQRIIERTLQMMIETCIDVAGHIISDQSFRIPKSYSDAFTVLHENDIIDEKRHSSLKKMSQFRNIVVHQYEKIDSGIVVGILQRDLEDFIAYRESIIRYIKSLDTPSR
jgi:uncharacterized protein YutE (UPF0331/DUF86 family)